MNRLFLYIIIAFALLPLPACGDRMVKEELDDIGSYIREKPDSALAAIRAIDTSTLTSRALRAQYSLLHAIALDKNWIDTTDVNVVLPAIAYYSRHGSTELKAKAYYYLGRIQQNAKDNESAIVSFTRANEYSSEYDTTFKGLILMAFADIYKKAHSTDKEIDCINRAIGLFESAKDSTYSTLALGRLAMAYQEKKEWDIADSLYRRVLQSSVKDTGFVVMYLSYYAAMKLFQPEKDPECAIENLKHIVNNYHHPLSARDYGVYALASILVGDEAICDSILDMISNLPDNYRSQTLYYEYRIADYRGDHLKAIQLLKKTYSDQDSLVACILGQSVTRALQDYYHNRAEETKHELWRQKVAWLFLATMLVILLVVVIFLFHQRRTKDKKQLERLLKIIDESNDMLLKKDSDAKATEGELKDVIIKLQNSYAAFFQSYFKRIGELCKAYLDGYDKKEAVYNKVEGILQEINTDEDTFTHFEYQVNQYLDHVLDHLKEDLNVTRPLDRRFLCYTVAGFNAGTISVLLNISLENVYTRRSRLRASIRKNNSPYKELYCKYLGI